MLPFYLKNMRATYQPLVNAMFKDQIRKMIEVYVDDMFVKIQIATDHVYHL